jgi:hypothetical protein
MEILSEK